MKKIGFRAALKMFGAINISLHANGGPACTDFSGFFEGTGVKTAHASAPLFKAGQTYYVTFGEARCGLPSVMHREAKDRKDYHGGQNQWSFESMLRNEGYVLKPMTDTRKPRW